MLIEYYKIPRYQVAYVNCNMSLQSTSKKHGYLIISWKITID